MKAIAKTLTYRMIGVLEVTTMTYVVTGKLGIAAAFAIGHFAYKTAMYYGYEVTWTALTKGWVA